MIWAAVDFRNKRYYTYLSDVFKALGGAQRRYNWLVTDCECYPSTPEYGAINRSGYVFLTGDELTKVAETEDFQWVWAAFTGFEKSIALDEILRYPAPKSDTDSFYLRPYTMQHPRSVIEIAAFDSSYTIFRTRDKALYDTIMASDSGMRELGEWNRLPIETLYPEFYES